MKKVLMFICLILLVHAGCLNRGEKENLERRVKELETYLEKYQKKTEECLELLRKASKISELCFPITERLDRLDSNVYGSKYLGNVRKENANPEEIISGYLNLIDRVERDLQ